MKGFRFFEPEPNEKAILPKPLPTLLSNCSRKRYIGRSMFFLKTCSRPNNAADYLLDIIIKRYSKKEKYIDHFKQTP